MVGGGSIGGGGGGGGGGAGGGPGGPGGGPVSWAARGEGKYPNVESTRPSPPDPGLLPAGDLDVLDAGEEGEEGGGEPDRGPAQVIHPAPRVPVVTHAHLARYLHIQVRLVEWCLLKKTSFSLNFRFPKHFLFAKVLSYKIK